MKKFFIFLLIPYLIFPNTIFQGIIWNGTTSRIVKSDKIEIIQLTNEGMKQIHTFENTSEFEIMLNNLFPYLVRVYYKDDIYSEIINIDEQKNKILKKKIYVYDTTNQIDKLIINTGYQITKYSEGLEINKIYAIQNKTIPPRTISTNELLFSLPEQAVIINATISHEKAQMPIRLNLSKVKEGLYQIDKNFKPGNTEIIILFSIPNYTYTYNVDPILLKLKEINNQERIMAVFMWRPEDAFPTIEGGEIKEKNIPDLGKAYLVYYESNPIKVDFSKGGFLYKNPLKAYSNPIFDKPHKTVLGILLGLFLIFLIIPIVSTSGVRIVRNAKT